MDLNGPGDADVWADLGAGPEGALAGLLRVGRAKISVQLSRVGASVQVYGVPELEAVGRGLAARLLPRLDGFVLVSGRADQFVGGLCGEYVLAGPGREPWGIRAVQGSLFGRRAVFVLGNMVPHGTPALAGREVVCKAEWNRGELRGHLLREFRPMAKSRLRAFLMGRGRRGSSLVRGLPLDVVRMIVAGVPLPFDE